MTKAPTRKNFLFKATMLISVALVSSIANASLVTNGDFESGSAGWTVTTAGACTGSAYMFTHGTGRGNGGGNAIGLNACGETNSDPRVEQTITGLTIGTDYELSWDYAYDHGHSGGTGTSFGVFLDALVLDLTEHFDINYVSRSITFSATQNTHVLAFASELDARTSGVTSTSDRSYFLDNVGLEEASVVPEINGGQLGIALTLLLSLVLLYREREGFQA